MKINKYVFVLLLLISISLICFGGTYFYVKENNGYDDEADIVIMTSCNPIYLAVSNIAGSVDGVTVTNLSQPQTGCLHDYTLTTEDMKNLSKADVLVVNGGGMEGYLNDVVKAYPDLPIIDSSENLAEYVIAGSEDFDAVELEELLEENSHMWMSEDVYMAQVHNIADQLSEMDDANSYKYQSNADAYCNAISSGIDKQGLERLMSGQNVAVLHEAFEYTAFSLGADVVAVMDLDEERQVSAGEVSEFLDAIEKNDVKIVLAEYDYGHEMGELIMEQTRARVAYLQTLVHGEYEGLDYVNALNENYKIIENVIYQID